MAIAVLVVVVLGGGGGVAWFLGQRSSSHSASRAAATVQATASALASTPAGGATTGSAAGGVTGRPTATKAPEPPAGGVAPDVAALNQLTALRADSVSRVPLDGRWVAQVASKWVGVTDPLQTAANGSHTFQATDILAESVAARSKVDDPSKVYVLWGTDFGKKSTGPNGAPIWVTIVDAGYASQDNVTQWCQVKFPSLTAQQLADTCAPRQLTPPHA